MAGISIDINLGKNQQKIELYNLEALQRILDEELPKGEDDGKGAGDKKDDLEWRKRLPSHMEGREYMIICSGGDCLAPSVDVVPKLRDNSMVDSELQLLRKELDVVQDKMRGGENSHLIQVSPDFPGAQKSKDYYLEKMKQLMIECKQPGGEYTLASSPCPLNGSLIQRNIWRHNWERGENRKESGRAWCIGLP